MGGMVAVASRSDSGAEDSHERHAFAFESVIDGICAMPWERLSGDDILCVAKAYYFFSIQFRENLDIACGLRPRDAKLAVAAPRRVRHRQSVALPRRHRARREARSRRIHAAAARDAAGRRRRVHRQPRPGLSRPDARHGPDGARDQHRQLRGRRLEPGVRGDAAGARLAAAQGSRRSASSSNSTSASTPTTMAGTAASAATCRSATASCRYGPHSPNCWWAQCRGCRDAPSRTQRGRGPSSRLQRWLIGRWPPLGNPKFIRRGIKVHTASRPTDRGSDEVTEGQARCATKPSRSTAAMTAIRRPRPSPCRSTRPPPTNSTAPSTAPRCSISRPRASATAASTTRRPTCSTAASRCSKAGSARSASPRARRRCITRC